jgi:hypothetical protein
MRNQIIRIIKEALANREEFFTREQEIKIYLSDYLNRKNLFDNVYLEYHIPSNSLVNYQWEDSNNINIVVQAEEKYYPMEVKFKTKIGLTNCMS